MMISQSVCRSVCLYYHFQVFYPLDPLGAAQDAAPNFWFFDIPKEDYRLCCSDLVYRFWSICRDQLVPQKRATLLPVMPHALLRHAPSRSSSDQVDRNRTRLTRRMTGRAVTRSVSERCPRTRSRTRTISSHQVEDGPELWKPESVTQEVFPLPCDVFFLLEASSTSGYNPAQWSEPTLAWLEASATSEVRRVNWDQGE